MKQLAAIFVILAMLSAPARAQTLPEDDPETMLTDTGTYHLIKYGLAGREPLATIYGFVNDKSVCQKLADRLNAEVAQPLFTCEPK